MSKNFGIFTIFLINIFSSQLLAETWSCSYSYQNKLRKYEITRQGNALVTPQGSRNKILYENEKVIYAYDFYAPRFKTFYALNIDKEKRMFSFIGLEPGNDTVLATGKCKVF